MPAPPEILESIDWMKRLGEMIPLTKLPDHIPRRPNGRKLSVQAVCRWAAKGIDGRKLRTLKIGGCSYVHPAWLESFFESRRMDADAPTSPTKARRSTDRALAELQSLGAA